MNASPTTLLTKALCQNVTTQQTLANMGLLSTFSINTNDMPLPKTDTDKTNMLLYKLTSTFPSTPSSSSSSSSSSSIETTNSNSKISRRKPSELKFKMESMGAHPEQDDDLDMCPARTRANWPRTPLTPWWQPSQSHEKPPYSYATLIAYAILISQDGRLLLSDIYRWISETYPYYPLDKRGWQNSIRHNLSLNKKWFIKVDRRPTQANPGKGCYWTLVPGTEEMFIENITEAGGHNRKHHDVGLTAELSMGHRNNLLARHNNNRFEPSAPCNLATVPPKSCKPSAPTPWMGPMYSTFRMTSTTMESVSQDSSLKKQKRHHSIPPSSKRPKLDDDEEEVVDEDGDDYMNDTQSDCDSGVDVSNEPLDDKKQVATMGDLTTTHDNFDLYNVLDHFLDQLPLPETQMDPSQFKPSEDLPGDSSSSNDFYMYASQPIFPSNPADLDPVLGYPSWDYYSTNGFYCDGSTTMFPTLLTSCFNPSTANVTNDAMLPNDTYYYDASQPYPQQDKAPLVIHLNGGIDEEMTDTYLKFEDDDVVLDTTTFADCQVPIAPVDFYPQDYTLSHPQYA